MTSNKTTSIAVLILTASVGGLLAVACGGDVDSPSSSSTAQAAIEGEAAQKRASTSSGSSSDCRFVSNGGSGGVDGTTSTCEASSTFRCEGEQKKIVCGCSAETGSGKWGGGSCTCGDLTFEFDCANACKIGPAEYERCGLPAPPPSSGRSGSGSSGSGSPASSSSGGGFD